MIKQWLEDHGWTCVKSDDEDNLYTKGSPVAMNTAAALFSELLDREVALTAAREDLADAAREINCAGPVAHRIRMLKQEHSREVDALNASFRPEGAK